MPRDYAKKKTTKKTRRGASRGKKQTTVPTGLWLFTVAAVLALASGLIYLKWIKPQSPAPTPKVISPATQPVATGNPPTADEVDEVPFYDVHEDLTNKKVEIPKEDLKLPDNYKKYFYTMPCGSFRDPARADELKAMIGLTGNNSSITDVQWKGETWYRVQLGPFNSKRTAEKIRHRLQDNGIHDCRITPHLKK